MDNQDQSTVEPSMNDEQIEPVYSAVKTDLAVKKSKKSGKPETKDENEWHNVIVISRKGDNITEKVAVPVDEAANRAASQLLVAKTRKALTDTMDRYMEEKRVLEPKQWVDLANAAKLITELSLRVYGDSKQEGSPSANSMNTALGTAIGVAIKATADAVNKGGDQIMEKVDDVYAKINRAKEKMAATIVTPEEDKEA